MLTIVDYGVGNLASIRNMLKKIGVSSQISSNQDEISKAEKLILPGVGAFDACAGKLQQSGLVPVLNKKVKEERTPVLGICVGMQLLTKGSEEGQLPGLNWVRGEVVRFRSDKMPAGTKIPHMGWTDVTFNRHSVISEELVEPRFYFVHSYHVVLDNADDVLMFADYGYPFAAALQHDNIMGVQFHPEKSHKYGMKLLSNFVNRFS